jgi:hypothetical protein
MSVDQQPAATSMLSAFDDNQADSIPAARQKAEEARRLAAARGDYLSAERWYRQEQLLDSQLASRDRSAADIVRI